MKKNLNVKYEGMGFVDALLAIMLVGMASVVLMQIASNAVKTMVQNETIDMMTQYAVEGSTMVQDIATQETYTQTNVFPDVAGCYFIEKNDNRYKFKEIDESTYQTCDLNLDRESCKLYGTIDDTKYFRTYCIDETVLSDEHYVVVKVVVGQTNSDGTITKGNNVKDYSYYTVVKL